MLVASAMRRLPCEQHLGRRTTRNLGAQQQFTIVLQDLHDQPSGVRAAAGDKKSRPPHLSGSR
jgi:hypothetical protein